MADFPVYMLIEPTSVCNLRCTMCFQVDPTFTTKKYLGFIDMEFYTRMVDEMAQEGTHALTLASRGEPTLHPKFGELLAYASGKFIDLKVNTNATRLSEKLCHDILSSGVNELVFSIDAHRKELYEQIRVKGKFDQVLANLRQFSEIRERHYPDSCLHTRVSGVKFRDDQELSGFQDFWSQWVDQVGYVEIEQRWDTYANAVRAEIQHPCTYLWERMYVWYDGVCNPCDVDYKSLLTTGNAKEKSLREIWHGPMFTQMREKHQGGKRIEFSPCDRCGV